MKNKNKEKYTDISTKRCFQENVYSYTDIPTKGCFQEHVYADISTKRCFQENKNENINNDDISSRGASTKTK